MCGSVRKHVWKCDKGYSRSRRSPPPLPCPDEYCACPFVLSDDGFCAGGDGSDESASRPLLAPGALAPGAASNL